MYFSDAVIKNFLMIFSFILSIILMLIKLPLWMDYLRPQFVILTLIFWSMYVSPKSLVYSAWILGLLTDVMLNVVLGQHALVFVLISYIVLKCKIKFKFFSLWQKMMFVFAMVCLALLPQFYVSLYNHELHNVWLYGFSPLISALILPFWEIVLDGIKNRFRNISW